MPLQRGYRNGIADHRAPTGGPIDASTGQRRELCTIEVALFGYLFSEMTGLLNVFTTGNPFFSTNLLEVSIGRDFEAIKGLGVNPKSSECHSCCRQHDECFLYLGHGIDCSSGWTFSLLKNNTFSAGDTGAPEASEEPQN